ncbi:hypothetical protein JJB09_18655 [Rhizobium sp. KVB221]|uniref:Uncharacterized protein n=1 Tax=Rhizobium setariae TaxID=2801340 RepID=A0A937CNR1_9HYPH|nr:hypothetical protein [Rhizobium setariae]MBL0374046.1 hypothetical protein [Rhizobium setariae]
MKHKHETSIQLSGIIRLGVLGRNDMSASAVRAPEDNRTEHMVETIVAVGALLVLLLVIVVIWAVLGFEPSDYW